MTSNAKAPHDSDQRETISRALQEARGSSESVLSDLGAQLESLRSAAIAANGDDEHDPEGSTIAFEAAQLETLRERAEEHLAEVDRAMERLELGLYGICARCKRPIGKDRLAALPATEFCVECAGRRRGVSRPS
jgi:DnaK suppressor protein